MGSGLVANNYVFRLVGNNTQLLEKLGKDFLIKIFGSDGWEDFIIDDKEVAKEIRNLVYEDLSKGNVFAKSDMVETKEGYKISFFK